VVDVNELVLERTEASFFRLGGRDVVRERREICSLGIELHDLVS